MQSLEEQLAQLRRRMAMAAKRADRQMARQGAQLAAARAERRRPPLEELVPGREVETAVGKHYETSRLYPRLGLHGSFEISRLEALPDDLFDGIGEAQIRPAPPQRWAFLDTETTGLAGGSGTCAFLIGIGRIKAEGFEVRQFFMRDYPEEPSQLRAVSEVLADTEVVITYNGRCFDLPLLETRFRMNRAWPPLGLIAHLDLLYGARRVWKLRYESCKLTDLESRVIGYERYDDIAGELIPEAYFDFVRFGRAARLAPVFDHNALDLLSLACLTAIVPWAFRDGGRQLKHGAEIAGLARYLRQAGRTAEAREMFRSALTKGLRDDLAFQTMWDLAELDKKAGAHESAIAIYADLAACRNRYRVDALVELAKHYEHRQKNYAMALEFASAALEHGETPALRTRMSRLRSKAARCATASLFG